LASPSPKSVYGAILPARHKNAGWQPTLRNLGAIMEGPRENDILSRL
jgi:hypothetical protein